MNAIKFLAEILTFAEVNGNCILAATLSNFSDYEDAVVDAVAKNVKADYILTSIQQEFSRLYRRRDELRKVCAQFITFFLFAFHLMLHSY